LNAVFPYRGIYGGGPLPSDPKRITYDQPISGNRDDIRAKFRANISYQKLSQRIGYLCSKNSLLVCDESRSEKVRSSLLKSYCFAIMDGSHRYRSLVWDYSINIL
jgi:hypothetical protein